MCNAEAVEYSRTGFRLGTLVFVDEMGLQQIMWLKVAVPVGSLDKMESLALNH